MPILGSNYHCHEQHSYVTLNTSTWQTLISPLNTAVSQSSLTGGKDINNVAGDNDTQRES